MKVHLLFNLLFDFLCKDFLTRNILYMYLPTYFLFAAVYYRIFTFFSKITQLCPQLFLWIDSK